MVIITNRKSITLTAFRPQPPQIAELLKTILDKTTNEDLSSLLQSYDSWQWPRSDLHAWVKVLNKFDAILEEVISDYQVDKLQTRPFSLEDRNVLVAILRFERLLLENSTNRKIYSSYDVCIVLV
jgi:E3 ubiquitin-protein ligase HUWE1